MHVEEKTLIKCKKIQIFLRSKRKKCLFSSGGQPCSQDGKFVMSIIKVNVSDAGRVFC
jgi:hypothetical protein